jgi:cupin 2 domain-containing protein
MRAAARPPNGSPASARHGSSASSRTVRRARPGSGTTRTNAEFVAVLAGAARLRFADGEMMELRPGDWFEIAAHRRHRVEWTDPETPTVWLTVFYR